MPNHEQTISLNGMETDTALTIAMQAMQQLQWPVTLATESILVGNTPRSWKTYGQQITLTAVDDGLTVKSEMVHGEIVDLGNRNKKNVLSFITAWEAVAKTADVHSLSDSQEALTNLRSATVVALQEESAVAAEVDKVMNLSGSNLYATYTIIAINVIVFVLMLLNGAGLMVPDGLVHIRWGSNYTPLTLSGDWWRLVTNTFIHFGVIHLAMNMYSLYMVGMYLEPMLGKLRYLAAYLATGVLASLVSLWWHADGTNSAGASGAIFGMYGLFLALLTTSLIPKQVRQSLLGSIGIFVMYNLFYGMKGGVDNAAHIGGVLSGFGVGYLYALSIKKEKEGREPLRWMVPAVVAVACLAAFVYLQQHKTAAEERQKIVQEIADQSHQDYDAFNAKLGEFDALQTKVFALLQDDNITRPDKKQKITDSILPLWNNMENVLDAAKKLDVSPASTAKADKLLQYVGLRKKQMQLLLEIADKGALPAVIEQHNQWRDSAEKVFAAAVK